MIPVWRAAANVPPKDEASWTGVWKGLDLEHALAPVKLVQLKPEIPADTVAALAAGDGAAMRGLVNVLKSELIVVALAEPDPGKGRLNVTIAGRDAVGAFSLKRSYRVDPADPNYAAELAGVVSLGVLEGRWKAISEPSNGATAAAPAPPPYVRAPAGPVGYAPQPPPANAPPPASAAGAMQVAVEFRGMSEWQDISRKLAATPGIRDLDVAGLSARGARITFRYADDPQRLAQMLEGQGLSLRSNGGAWVLSAK